MPPPELAFRTTDVLAWPAVGQDSHSRWLRSATVSELKVRWVDTAKTITDDQGNPLTIDVEMATDVELPIGTPVWKGSYEDLGDAVGGTGTGLLVPNADIYQVVTTEHSADHRGNVNGYVHGLRRLGARMPDVGTE